MAKDKAYRAAEKKIEEARRSRARRLDLVSMELTELPESIGQLTLLIDLNLPDNELTVLPESIGQLTQLQSLDLSSNQLKTLPELLGQLTQLTELNLSGNQLTVLPDSLGPLAALTQLQSLNLSNNQLTTLPDSLGPLAALTQLTRLDLSNNQLTVLPDSLGQLTQLHSLDLMDNQLTMLPKSFGNLTQLVELKIVGNKLSVLPAEIGFLKKLELIWAGGNNLTQLPDSFGNLIKLKKLWLGDAGHGNPITSLPNCLRQLRNLQDLTVPSCQLSSLPDWIDELENLDEIWAEDNQLNDIPHSIIRLPRLTKINLKKNPLNPELAEAYKQGIGGVKAYLRAKAEAQIILNEAKLILVGEGEVGKTCLMDALLDKEWQEHSSTHGIEIQQVKVTNPETKTAITLNGWDFGGQRVYHPTHQLFFSAPAVYLVVWKPREGPQQGFVKEWIQLVKRREPSAKIIVVATHGGPQQRQPDIDRQELWDTFGKNMVVDFFHVESNPNVKGGRRGIEELKLAIARVAATLPEVGRSVPKSFTDVRTALGAKGGPYLPVEEVLNICRAHNMDDEVARLFITISHRLGHLTHYENDPALRDIVILRPDWLATAMSYILDDEVTRKAHGLVEFSRLGQLWDDQARAAATRYPSALHPIFLRLMERFDLSYRVADPAAKDDSDPLSLIGQLVPDNRPDNLQNAWLTTPSAGDLQQTQICRIVDASNGQSASAEGLFYQLIIRLHKYSLGRVNYNDSVHWQKGLVLDNAYNGRAFLEHKGNDVHITVRAPYPERFLAMLTAEVKYLVESFWEGLRCDVMVPCVEPCGKKVPGTAVFEVEKLIAFRRQGLTMFPCMVSGCNQIQDIDGLLRNAPVATAVATESFFLEFVEVKRGLAAINQKVQSSQADARGWFEKLDGNDQRLLSRVDDAFESLLRALSDEAKEGPRLFSFVPVPRGKFDPRNWATERFRLTLWCENSRLPLTMLNEDKKVGVYEFDVKREWVRQAAPFLKALTITLRTVLPVAFSAAQVFVDPDIYQAVENELDFSNECIDALVGETEGIAKLFVEETTGEEAPGLPRGKGIRAEGAILREFHSLLESVDKSKKYGNLVRVMNKRQEFLWVHARFAGEY